MKMPLIAGVLILTTTPSLLMAQVITTKNDSLSPNAGWRLGYLLANVIFPHRSLPANETPG